MKKIFSFLAAVLFAGSMMAENVVLEFKTTGTANDGNSTYTKDSNPSDVFATGASLVSDITAAANFYPGRDGRGAKSGGSSKAGSLSFTLETPVTASQIIVKASPYISSNKAENCPFTVNDSTILPNQTTTTFVAEDYTITYATPVEISTINIVQSRASNGRFYILSLTIVPAEVAPAANDTIYFVNAADWAAVKVHAWGGTAAGTTWPGLDVTKADYQLQGKDVYYFVAAPGAYANCLFNNNNNGAQTADLVWADGVNKYYFNGAWYTRAELETPVVVDMFIKHNWAENPWTWKQMTYDAETETYLLREIYGASGCNWNTKADNNGAAWIENPTLVGNPAVGDSAVFAFKNGAITITKIGEANEEPTTRFLKHNWGGAGDWSWKEMTREGETDTYTLRDIYGGTGCNWNTLGVDAGNTWVGSPTLVGEPAVGDSAVFSLTNGEITITKIETEGPGPEPKPFNYYLAGTMTGWSSQGMDGDSVVLNLEAGEHGFKVQLVAGYWETALGFSAVNAECSSEGLTTNSDGNVCFTLAEAGDVKIKVVEGQICVTGVFTTPEPTLPQVDLKGINNDWAGVTMTAAEDKLTCSYTHTLTAGDYEFKIHVEGGTWLGNNGTMTRENCTDWVFDTAAGNCHLTADVDGDYIFTYEYETRKVSVTFPENTATGINNIDAATATKVVRNGQIYILREGVLYNVNGAVVR